MRQPHSLKTPVKQIYILHKITPLPPPMNTEANSGDCGRCLRPPGGVQNMLFSRHAFCYIHQP